MIRRAMVFAAGKGQRMLPLTEKVPKPLLKVGDKSLLEHLLNRLAKAGIEEAIINAAYLAEQIVDSVESMSFPSMSCQISKEDTPLETGGALVKALPMLGDSHFLLCNSDVWTDFDIQSLIGRSFAAETYAHLILVPSPEHNQTGDFCLLEDGRVVLDGGERLYSSVVSGSGVKGRFTFSGLSVIHPALVERYARGRTYFPMRDLLFEAIAEGRVTGELYEGPWIDVGTPERLEALRQSYDLSLR